ncbi:hypothetical protein [Anoxybacillus sp. KU2-6(11)]|uniref:Ger(x)C family spore germination protein n=1 Tax=Anoxybacillus sp. KU2-6(11) TaxID=1535751 RepID=UPI001E3F4398|nr:hypothetical protein [Anoxybacillus sp. KU2-6(11)]
MEKRKTLSSVKRSRKNTTCFPTWMCFRDPKNSTTANFIVFDGPLKELMYIRLDDKPRLSVAIRDVILNGHINKQTTKINMLLFHRLSLDRAQTPFAPILKVHKGDLVAAGIALFNRQRKYVGSLSQKESPYLRYCKKILNLRHRSHSL